MVKNLFIKKVQSWVLKQGCPTKSNSPAEINSYYDYWQLKHPPGVPTQYNAELNSRRVKSEHWKYTFHVKGILYSIVFTAHGAISTH